MSFPSYRNQCVKIKEDVARKICIFLNDVFIVDFELFLIFFYVHVEVIPLHLDAY